MPSACRASRAATFWSSARFALDVRSGEILAWPRRAGGTGQTVYRWTRQAGLQRMANQAGQWTGTEVPPGTGEAWQSLSDDG